MVRPISIWFMESVSSQKDILALVRQARDEGKHHFLVIASHRDERPEILSQADYAYLEPAKKEELLPFIKQVCEKHNVIAIHAGKRGQLLECWRPSIEMLGVKLTTGANNVGTFELADNKTLFCEQMIRSGLPSVQSIQVQSSDEVVKAITYFESNNQLPCIKPVRGIYGLGFWILNRKATYLSFYNNAGLRQINPDIVVTTLRDAAERGEELPLQIVMPYLAGPERSVDLLVENGRVIAAVARRKNGSIQTLESDGQAYQLAIACAEALKADGLINVQVRNDENDKPVLLETNLRPSGGIGYSSFCGVNLPGLFALRQLGLVTTADVRQKISCFNPERVIPSNNVHPLPVCTISTLDAVQANT